MSHDPRRRPSSSPPASGENSGPKSGLSLPPESTDEIDEQWGEAPNPEPRPATSAPERPGAAAPVPSVPLSTSPAPVAVAGQRTSRAQTLIGVAPMTPPVAGTARTASEPAPPAHEKFEAAAALQPQNKKELEPLAEAKIADARATEPAPQPSEPSPDGLVARDAKPAAADAAQTARPSLAEREERDAAPPASQGAQSRGRGAIWVLAGLAAGAFGLWTAWQHAHEEAPPAPVQAVAPQALTNTDIPPEMNLEQPKTAAPAGSVEALPPVASASAAVPETASPAPSATQAPAPNWVRVLLKSVPPGAVFYHHGKSVGVNEATVSVPEGKKLAFEVALPGYGTRKVIVDGKKPTVIVGLRPAEQAETKAGAPVTPEAKGPEASEPAASPPTPVTPP